MSTGVVNVYPNFSTFGGAEKMIFTLHKNLGERKNNLIMGFTSFSKFNHKIEDLKKEDFKRLSIRNIREHKNLVFISHHRKTTLFLILISKIFRFKLKIIHVAHNEFSTLKNFTFFPNNIIAVSEKVKKNLVEYFNQDKTKIKVIYNGLEDNFKNTKNKEFNNTSIRILYPARVNKIKQQVEVVKQLQNKLHKNIGIDFAGIGEDLSTLNIICSSSTQFNSLGFIDIHEAISNYDFIMLYSQNEGLPLGLIESCMYKKPILTNNVGGNLEILNNGHNGFELSDLKELSTELNKLSKLTQQEYTKLSLQARQTYEKKFQQVDMLKAYQAEINSF